MLKTFSNKGEANAIPLNAENLNFNFTELINILWPIGSYYDTSDATFDPNTAWCGTWVLENDGTVLVSKSNTTGSIFNTDVEKKVGEETHSLTIYELPPKIPINYGNISGGTDVVVSSSVVGTGGVRDGQANMNLSSTGKAFNNVQPSKICFRWHRTA